jgi:hypothetical protein
VGADEIKVNDCLKLFDKFVAIAILSAKSVNKHAIFEFGV